jgi:PAS domain S-box-containing protein
MQNAPREQLTEEVELMRQRIAELEASNRELQALSTKMEHKYHDLFENAGDSIFIVDSKTFRIVDANSHASRRLGYQPNELLQLRIDDVEVLDASDMADQGLAWESTFSHTRVYEAHFRRKDGSVFPVEVSSRIVTFDGVTVLRNFVRDITHRKELERKHKQAEADIKRLARVIDQASETILMTDLSGKIIYANPHFEAMTGYTVEEALGQNPRMLKSGMQDDDFYAELWTTIAEGNDWHGTLTNRRKDGSLFYAEAIIFPIRNPENHITHFAAVERDITDRVLAEQEREQLIDELNAFAQTVAHDLKSPLMLLSGYSNLMLDYYNQLPEDQLQEMLKGIDSSSAKMVKIVDELLILASTRQSSEIQKAPLDMPSIVNEALARLKVLIDQQHAEIVIVKPETWPIALGYGPWIEEVWANYISNAVKYGGEPPRVELGASLEDNDTVRFWVRDNGQGLSPEQQAELFKPFTRLSDLRLEGHGLGLSIVQRIIGRLDGQVSVESTPGQGSVFSFTLPVDYGA